MPRRAIPGTDASYFLVAVNQGGKENAADPDSLRGPISEQVLASLRRDGITDAFIWIHGWKGDVKEAFAQFDRWIGAFANNADDHQEMCKRRPGFKALHIGFHWPSLAWGDEALASGDSFAPGAGMHAQSLEDFHATELGDSPAVRNALHKLFDELRTNAAESGLTGKARDAYVELDKALALGNGGRAGDGSADRFKFDPDEAVAEADTTSFGAGAVGNKLLAPLRQLTFWTMKKRAKDVGETGLLPLLASMQAISPSLRVHLMGHSFGCVVASSALARAGESHALARPIDSCMLVQGAASMWAFAKTNPFQGEVAGFFHPIISGKIVSGPLVATRSKFDYALGKIYPWAAGIANQVSFGPPQFGAVGIHGFCGLPDTINLPMNTQYQTYQLKPGCIYNVDGSDFIRKIDGASGAHSDIAGPEVAHLIWQAAMPETVNER